MRWLFVAPVLVLGLTPELLLAEETVPNFQYDPFEYWATRILTWTLILSMFVAFYALVRVFRRQMTGVGTKVLLLIGVALLPVFSVSTGMLLAFVRAERVEFCGSCHRALKTYVDEMRDPESEGLAAIHYRFQYIASNQCYECHTSYGLFGTMKAKIHGVRQVMRYYTGTYETPLKMWKPYSNADCLKCHARSSKWRSSEEHASREMREDLFKDRTSCMDCHAAGHLDDIVVSEAQP